MRARAPIAIFVLALVARGLAAVTLSIIPRDGIVIVETARAVAGGDVGAAIYGDQHPLLPLLAGALGGTETAAVIVAALFGAIGALALYRIGDRLHGRATGLVAGLIGAVAPALVRFSSVPLAESVAIPLALWAAERTLATRESRYAGVVAGLLAGAAFLARPEALLLPLVLVPGLLFLRRPVAALLLLIGFAALSSTYIRLVSVEAGELTFSRKKPAARYFRAEEGFDAHMKEKSSRTGIDRPGIPGAAVETARSLGEAATWALLPLALIGAVLLLREGRTRPEVLLLLLLLGADLLLRFRHVHLHGYLSKRHLVFAAALLVPLAARTFVTRGRVGAIVAAVLCAVFLAVSVKPRDQDKVTIAEAGRQVLAEAGEGQRIATWLTPRIPYYARGKNVKLNRLRPDMADADPEEIRILLVERADRLAIIPARLDEKTRRTLERAAAGFPSRETGAGEWRVVVYSIYRP